MTTDTSHGSLPTTLAAEVTVALNIRFGLDMEPGQAAVTVPPNPDFGDLSCAVALPLARQLRRNPLEIAQELADELRSRDNDLIAEVTVTPPGYINFLLDPVGVITQFASGSYRRPLVSRVTDVQVCSDSKVVIEHTNINPNKAAHIGHLRNACLGDSIARLLRTAGMEVEVQNYIDDTGSAVADIVVGLEAGEQVAEQERFDDYCWDLYTRVHQLYEQKPEFMEQRQRVLALIEQSDNDTARQALEVARRIVEYHLDTMAAVGVDYDLLTWESHILFHGFWNSCFGALVKGGALVKEQQGDNAGCWVVPLSDHPGFTHLENPDKVLIRSDGTATYTAKDIAYQLWKFGLLQRDFHYHHYRDQWSGKPLYSTTEQGETSNTFGRGDVAINVIDVRQSYLQDILKACLERLGFDQAGSNSIHFAYEVVVLSEEAARKLGMNPDSDSVAMSGRKGVGVKAHELIDTATQLARQEVLARHADWPRDKVEHTARAVAAAAIRYYMIRFRSSVILAFDFTDALSLTGKTGPYLQYSYARACRIVDKVVADDQEMTGNEVMPAERRLIVQLVMLARRMEEAASKLEVSVLAEHTYDLASAFMGFYEECPVNTAGPGIKARRLQLVMLFRSMMEDALSVLGIPRLTEM